MIFLMVHNARMQWDAARGGKLNVEASVVTLEIMESYVGGHNNLRIDLQELEN